MNTYIKNKFRLTNCVIVASALLLFCGLQSCGNDENDIPGTDNLEVPVTASLELRLSSANAAKNALIYVFENSKFSFVPLNMTPNNNIISGPIKVNEDPGWDLVLLTCDQNIKSNIKTPAVAAPMSTTDMWQTPTQTVGTDTYLTNVPDELHYIRFDKTKIYENVNPNKVSGTPSRLVGEIRIVLKDHVGFNESPKPKGYIKLHKIPTTLTWDGKLSVDNTNIPVVSAVPLYDEFKFASYSQQNKKDSVRFYVPADPTYTSTSLTNHKIELEIGMELTSGNMFIKKVELEQYPKANFIYRVEISKFSGEPDALLNISVSVKDWEDEKVEDVTLQ